MTNITARIAGLATLALAALPFAALTTVAHAQGVAHQTVQIADLNLASAAGKTTFNQRVEAAARRFCISERAMDMQASCRAGVRAEANEKAATNVQLATRL